MIGNYILAFAESNLKTSAVDENVTLEGFQLNRNDQQNTAKPHHDLAIYIGHNIEVHDITWFNLFNFECIVATVKKQEECLQVAVVYKSPQCSYSELKTTVRLQLKPQIRPQQKFVIIGDFNVDVSAENDTFSDWMEQIFLCKQIVSSVTTDQRSKLDLIFTNIKNSISSTIECCWRDHKLVYCAVSLTV